MDINFNVSSSVLTEFSRSTPYSELSNKNIKTGEVIKCRLHENKKQRYYLYVPTHVKNSVPLMVSVHGISRNARTHARCFAHFAEHYGVIILAPLFDKKSYPSYQRLGIKGERPDIALQQMIKEVTSLTGVDNKNIYLFGYSGGGQFVHRFAMAYPHNIAAIAIGAAGWYTFPSANQRFPYGIGCHHKLPDLSFQLDEFLRIPTYVLVGEQDTARDAALRKTRRLDKTQGKNRFERGQRWISSMQNLANSRNLKTEYRFIALADADHSFSRCDKHGGMTKRVFQCLFDT